MLFSFFLLIKFRTQRLLKQIDIALELEMSQSAYAKIENGRTSLNVDRLLKIANYLNVDIRGLLQIDNNNQSFEPNSNGKSKFIALDNSLFKAVIKSKEEQISLLKTELEFLKTQIIQGMSN